MTYQRRQTCNHQWARDDAHCEVCVRCGFRREITEGDDGR